MHMIPKDPFMALSYVNTQLRDNYESLEELCDSMGISQEEVKERILKAGYVYSEEKNAFVPR